MQIICMDGQCLKNYPEMGLSRENKKNYQNLMKSCRIFF